MSTFGINTFRSVRDGVHQRTDDLQWEEFVTVVTEQGHRVSPTKDGVPLFNATRFKTIDEVVREDRGGFREDADGMQFVRRQQKNAVAVELLILDYDGTLTLEEARARFKDHEYLGYTSYSHMKKPGVHKFRLIFPLTSPIPAHRTYDEYGMLVGQGAYHELSEALIEFAPGCDPVVTKAVQPYYVPSAPEERVDHALIWRNRGAILDWTTWKRNSAYAADAVDASSDSPLPRKTNGLPNRILEPDQMFNHRRGTVIASEVKGRLQHVDCPFHGDARGSEFLVRYASGVVCFHCKRCGSFSLPPPSRLTPSAQKEVLSIEAESDIAIEMDEAWLDHTDRLQVERFLAGVKKDILADKAEGMGGRPHFKSHVLYLPEGAGKSQLALNFLSDPPASYFPQARGVQFRHQIIFACKSWKQVIEKEASFRDKLKEIGRTSRIAWSFDGSIDRRFNVKIKRRGGRRPFAPGDMIEEDTIREIMRANPHLSETFIRVAWAIMGDDKVRFQRMAVPDVIHANSDDPLDDEDLIFDDMGEEPPAIIFTTFAQLRLVGAKFDRIPLNWIIWIDDPDLDEFLDIKRRPDGADTEVDADKVRAIDGTLYDVRPPEQSLGLAFKNHRCIYTTTEQVTLRLLKHHLDKHGDAYQVHGERRRVTGGKITMLGTDKVQTKFDALIPLLVRRLEKDHGTKTTLIADGIPADFNHSTNKGRNDLKERHILIELSRPHPAQIKIVCDALGLRIAEHGDRIGRELMIDKMHQAIGRNSGFRSAGFECVVLADKSRHAALLSECGYQLDAANSVIVDKTEKMGRKDTRLTASASPLVKQVDAFLNNPSGYLSDLRKVKPDIAFVLDRLDNPVKKLDYTVRLLVALTSLTGVRFDHNPSPSIQDSLLTIRELGEWVLTQIPQDHRQKVLTQYQEKLQDKVTVQVQE